MTCNSCKQGWLINGATGVARAALGVGTVDDDLIAKRLNICKTCEHMMRAVAGIDHTADVGLMDKCNQCGCYVRAKVKLDDAHCPKGRW
ncbi:hypothetical protein QG083_05075 [Kingella kingae]|uniref:hypothetical protein n=1 Tax=Kingella kingae TaxID=504 RepID=UPI002550B29A|nr:hypothetical protein [Kingella kingae]MDK4545156.1 hypothetical protein [Kingella kingae]MDK4612556.1 hypothetical protein [Kingella kingae]MDK4614686.1 hypothetical protein [Kingella kingae]MDK4617019.1 hypothetical protein [Kingella kingae]MDK4620939.1 hypothetical protein [Kingella kingae]